MLKMQVKSMTDALDEYIADMACLDLDEYYCSAGVLLSDDIWNKFELDASLCSLTEFDEVFRELDCAIPDVFVESSKFCEIRNHDCMWAGHCGSKEHPTDEYKLLKTIPKLEVLSPGPGTETTPAVKQQQPVASGRSLLLKTVTKTTPSAVQQQQPGVSPESPPISDDEDQKGQTLTLKILNDAIEEYEIEEDSDLCEYFEENDDLVVSADEKPPTPVPNQTPSSTFFNLQSDHCYHKDKNSSMMRVGLGIETPSDSEEEIDVVSIGDKQTFGLKSCLALPTNPSNKDRQQLQRTMASAISCKGSVQKATLLKRPLGGDSTPKRRGMKRKRKIYKTALNQSPYKKRIHLSNSSESEPETSEKRSLHNNMERKRRIDLRNAFEDLRVLIPQVNGKDRVAKVVILREAASYCDHLGDVSDSLERKMVEMRKQQQRLIARVSQLRKNLAAKR